MSLDKTLLNIKSVDEVTEIFTNGLNYCVRANYYDVSIRCTVENLGYTVEYVTPDIRENSNKVLIYLTQRN